MNDKNLYVRRLGRTEEVIDVDHRFRGTSAAELQAVRTLVIDDRFLSLIVRLLPRSG
jgi:hypothetical protein